MIQSSSSRATFNCFRGELDHVEAMPLEVTQLVAEYLTTEDLTNLVKSRSQRWITAEEVLQLRKAHLSSECWDCMNDRWAFSLEGKKDHYFAPCVCKVRIDLWQGV